MLSLSDNDRLKLTALMPAAELEHYEALCRNHAAEHPRKYKSLARMIENWWRRDALKRLNSGSGGTNAMISAPETATEMSERACAILEGMIRDRNRWIADAAKHTHGPDCQGGRVCRLAEHKIPLLPTLAEILEKI